MFSRRGPTAHASTRNNTRLENISHRAANAEIIELPRRDVRHAIDLIHVEPDAEPAGRVVADAGAEGVPAVDATGDLHRGANAVAIREGVDAHARDDVDRPEQLLRDRPAHGGLEVVRLVDAVR